MFLHREPLCGSLGCFSTAAAAAVHCCCVKTGSEGQMGQGWAPRPCSPPRSEPWGGVPVGEEPGQGTRASNTTMPRHKHIYTPTFMSFMSWGIHVDMMRWCLNRCSSFQWPLGVGLHVWFNLQAPLWPGILKDFFKDFFHTPRHCRYRKKKQVGIPYGNLLACSFERKRNFYLKMF